MASKRKFINNITLLIFISLLIFIKTEDDKMTVNYREDDKNNYEIEDLRPSLFNSYKDGIYFLGNDLIKKNRQVIAFSDLNGDKMTDIITFSESSGQFIFYVQLYLKDEGKFAEEKELFTITPTVKDEEDKEIKCDNCTVRNVFLGGDRDMTEEFYIVSYNYEGREGNLLHYLIRGKKSPIKLEIFSNIVIADFKGDGNKDILFYDYNLNKRRICKLTSSVSEPCELSDFSSILELSCTKTVFEDQDISYTGGHAFVDISGDCVGDLIITHEDSDNNRIIEIYLGYKKDKTKLYCLDDKNIINIGNSELYGAFTLTNINDYKDPDNAPMLDILVPMPLDNSVMILFNQRVIPYSWSDKYCVVYEKKYANDEEKNNKPLFIYDKEDITKTKIEKLNFIPDKEYEKIELDKRYPTIIRTGDFKGSSNPGIIVNQKIYYKDNSIENQINLYERKDNLFLLSCEIEIKKVDKDDSPLYGLFFDIDEEGQLGLIISSEKKYSYLFYNYKRNGFFLKSKVMNSEKDYYNTDIGTTYRYIVTSKSGDRHMDISYQLAQTSDMNIPLPYSLMGLDLTNNYVEYFHSISNTFLEGNYKCYDDISGDVRQNTPVIPNTQMMLHKYINSEGTDIEWLVDLIVQPMDKIWLFLAIVIVVLLAVLIIVIILHVKENREEEKEANKFKAWFA